MRTLAAISLLSATLVAQNSVTLPKLHKDSYAASGNLLPIARTKSFIQTWYHGQNLPLGTVVTQIGWRYDQSASSTTGIAHTMAVVLDNSPATIATFSNNYAGNLSATPVTFLPMQTVNWPAAPAGGLDPALWLPGNAPFVFTGPNLIVQVDVQTETTPRSLTGLNADAIIMSATSPWLIAVDAPGCASSSLSATASYAAPTVNLTFALNNGPANNQVVFLLGADNQAFGGATILPLDLGFLGMAGCKLGLDPITTVTLPTDGAGSAQLPAPVPVIPSVAQTLFAQGLHVGNTALGLVTTNTVGVVIGEQGLMNYAYSWTNFGPTAEFGPYPTARGAVMLMR